LRKVLRFDTTSLLGNNRAFHRLLRDGVPVEYRRPDGSIAGDRVQLLNFADPAANDWLAVNQFTVIEGQHNRRPDIVVFVNGLPLAVIELKRATDEDATICSSAAYKLSEPFWSLQPESRSNRSAVDLNAVKIQSFGLLKIWRSSDPENPCNPPTFVGRKARPQIKSYLNCSIR